MTTIPSREEMAGARDLLAALIKRGAHPWLDEDGYVSINGKATRQESAWLRAHRLAFRGALVEAKRYHVGSLDRIYGITPFGGSANMLSSPKR